jgi:serine kinase of HPr protein (carbohydrate metabolism regulator)
MEALATERVVVGTMGEVAFFSEFEPKAQTRKITKIMASNIAHQNLFKKAKILANMIYSP